MVMQYIAMATQVQQHKGWTLIGVHSQAALVSGERARVDFDLHS